MKSRAFDPRRLDTARFARAEAELDGRATWDQLPRLRESVDVEPRGESVPSAGEAPATGAPLPGPPGAISDTAPVRWSARGEHRRQRGGAEEQWLHLQAQAEVELVCQRCLLPVHERIEVDRRFRFASDEETAARLDAEIEDDVLVSSRALDLIELVEDELLLELPLVPRHASCRPPAGETPQDLAEGESRRPFEALAAWRKPDLR